MGFSSNYLLAFAFFHLGDGAWSQRFLARTALNNTERVLGGSALQANGEAELKDRGDDKKKKDKKKKDKKDKDKKDKKKKDKKKKDKKGSEEEEEEYVPLWHPDFVHPAGKELETGAFHSCACYGNKKGEGHDFIPLATPIPVEHVTSDTMYGGYKSCKEYCNSHGDGYFAADIDLLGSWSGVIRPAIIIVHGSGGDKDEDTIAKIQDYFMYAGYVTMSINYNSNTCQDDLGKSVAYMKEASYELGVDPEAIGLFGWSLGGQCVNQASYNNWEIPEYRPAAAINMAGCGGKGPFNSLKDMTVEPPAYLVLHSKKDNTIKIQDCYDMIENAEAKAKKNKKIDPIIKTKYYENGGHNLVKDPTKDETYDLMYDHFVRYLGRPCKVCTPPADTISNVVDELWPECKTPATNVKSVERCGGEDTDFGAEC